jgi:hypothetical protein
MITRGIIAFISILIASVLFIAACDVISEKGLDESLNIVPNVTAIEGAQNATIRVNSGSTSNFLLDIDNVEWNNLISNGTREAYCIAWKDPIGRDNTTYEGVGIFSTANDNQFASVNRLFGMKNALQKADPGITWKEIQIAVWQLLPFQEFDMNMPVSRLPAYMRNGDQPAFDKDRVQMILDAVHGRSTAKTAQFSELMNSNNNSKSKTMCVIGTNEDTQTLIVPCDESAFAYGGTFESDYTGVAGIPGQDPDANCFPNLEELTENRWGWTNGPLTAPYEASYPLYAGAGQCILAKGQLSGYVDVDYDGSNVSVTFRTLDGVTFQKTALYVGNDRLPKKNNGTATAAPGQYPYQDGDATSSSDTEVTYNVSASGNIYIIAHAVVDGYEEEVE